MNLMLSSSYRTCASSTIATYILIGHVIEPVSSLLQQHALEVVREQGRVNGGHTLIGGTSMLKQIIAAVRSSLCMLRPKRTQRCGPLTMSYRPSTLSDRGSPSFRHSHPEPHTSYSLVTRGEKPRTTPCNKPPSLIYIEQQQGQQEQQEQRRFHGIV